MSKEEKWNRVLSLFLSPFVWVRLSIYGIFFMSQVALYSQTIQLGGFGGVDTTINPKLSYGNWNINLTLSDSPDIMTADSIIKALDDRLHNREAKSEIYGHNIFEADSLRVYDSRMVFKVPDSYVIGEGDEISVSIFGASQFDAKYVVDAAGSISPDNMAKIFLRGINWGQAKQLISRRFSNFYLFRGDQIAISLSQPRIITVNIFGEVRQSGSFSLIATNTAFNALVAAGGLRNSGTVRDIRISYGGVNKTLDLYKMMQDPSVQFNLYLEDNVVIQVPVSGQVVSLIGAVKRPMKYELKDGEGLKELIAFGGGLTGNATTDIVQIKRFESGRVEMIDLNYEEFIENGKPFNLKDGDEVIIRESSQLLKNIVSIEGAVDFPGDYSLFSTKTLSELINKGRLARDARQDVAFLLRLNPDSTIKLIQLDLTLTMSNLSGASDMVLQDGDRLVVNSLSNFVELSTISITGAVKKEREHPFDPNSTITVQQGLLLAGGLLDEANDIGYILRTDIQNRNKKEYIEVDFRQALNNASSRHNMLLKPMDVLIAIARSEISDLRNIIVDGAVRNPDTLFSYEGMLLKDVVLLAGGLKDNASGVVDIYRNEQAANGLNKTTLISIRLDEGLNIIEGSTDFQVVPYDKIVARTKAEYKEQQFVNIEGEVRYPGMYALTENNETLQDLIAKAGGLSTAAMNHGIRVIRHHEKASLESQFEIGVDLSTSNSSEVMLMPNDVVVVPKQENVVVLYLENTKAGQLKINAMPVATAHEPNKNALWYIKENAGGVERQKFKKYIVVKYPNGLVKATTSAWPFRKYPKPTAGSSIYVMNLEGKEDMDNKLRPESIKNKGVIVNISTDKAVETSQKQEEPENQYDDRN